MKHFLLRKIVTVDLDSTIADTGPRHFMLTAKNHDKNDWHAYAKACHLDVPVPGVVSLMNLLHEAGYGLFIVSGRSKYAMKETLAWLKLYEVPFNEVILCDTEEVGDHLKYKLRRLQELKDEGYEIALHLDDWSQLREPLATELGIPMIPVVPPWAESPVAILK